eukprot:1186815-Prorocentrum_minimum.AAC.2
MGVEDCGFLRPRVMFSDTPVKYDEGLGLGDDDRSACVGKTRSSFLSDKGLYVQPPDLGCSSQDDYGSDPANSCSQMNCTQDFFWYARTGKLCLIAHRLTSCCCTKLDFHKREGLHLVGLGGVSVCSLDACNSVLLINLGTVSSPDAVTSALESRAQGIYRAPSGDGHRLMTSFV